MHLKENKTRGNAVFRELVVNKKEVNLSLKYKEMKLLLKIYIKIEHTETYTANSDCYE